MCMCEWDVTVNQGIALVVAFGGEKWGLVNKAFCICIENCFTDDYIAEITLF